MKIWFKYPVREPHNVNESSSNVENRERLGLWEASEKMCSTGFKQISQSAVWPAIKKPYGYTVLQNWWHFSLSSPELLLQFTSHKNMRLVRRQGLRIWIFNNSIMIVVQIPTVTTLAVLLSSSEKGMLLKIVQKFQ